MDTLYENACKFMITSRCINLRMRMFLTYLFRELIQTLYVQYFFSEILFAYKIMWKIMV